MIMLGSAIRAARKARGETLVEVAKRLGVTQQALSRVELGHPTTTALLEQFAHAVGLEIVAQPKDRG